MNGKLLIVLVLLIVAAIPASIAVDLLVWPGDDLRYPERPCGINWVGIVPLGGYCT